WQYSFIYKILASIYHVFSNAFQFSLFRKLMTRTSKLQYLYENCFISTVIDRVIDFVVRIFGCIAKLFKPAWNNSKIVKLCKGSVIFKFEFIFSAFVGAMYIVPHQAWSNMFAVLGAIGCLVIYTFLCALGERKVLYPKKLGLPLFIFAALTPVTMLFSSDRGNSIRILIFDFAAFLIMWLVASNTDSEEKLKRILAWVYITVIFTALYAIMQRVVGIEANPTFIDQELNPNVPARVFSTVDNPNNYAELLVLFMPLAAVFAMNIKDTTRRFIACIALAIPALALVMTYSRSGWLSIALTVFIFVYYTNKRLIPWMFVAAFLCLPFLPASVMTRLGNLFNTADSSASFRITLWTNCLRLLSMNNRWLTGIGLGPYTYNHNLLLVTTIKIAQSMPHTQMLYLELIMEWGIFGFISYMWFIVTKIISGACQIDKAKNKYVNGTLIAAVSSLVGIAILAVFEYIWFYPRIMFAYFVVVGLMIACIRMSKEEQ
ncbi:MAG: O-antigen ligase family protein, partial [Bacillota bacterium]|nr:O-antigen ligase family protein [Bacillota bacterium]